MAAIVNCSAYADGRRIGPVGLEQIPEIVKVPGQWVWIGLQEPTEELLKEVQHQFGLHDLAIEDAHRAHQRPKLERYGDSLFIVMRTVSMDAEGELAFGELHLFVGAQYIVSVRHNCTHSLADVRSRCEANPELLGYGPAFALYALMDFVVDQYFPVVDALEEKIDGMEVQVFNDSFDRAITSEIFQLKVRLLELKRAVMPLVDVCNQLVRFDQALIPERARPYFRDVYDHVLRINEMVDNMRELLTAALEANLSMVSVKQNEVTKQLAAWAAIIAVPTLVVGIYGMNFQNMPELKWAHAYPVTMGALAAVCGMMYWRFKKSGWL